MPTQADIARGMHDLGNPANNPITGAQEQPEVIGGERPPSLESLQAARPGINPDSSASTIRGQALREAALSYGARGGLAARAFAINEMLRRHEAELDAAYDFSTLVVPLGGGQTLMRPPVVTEAQMAFALGDGGQVARETGRVYQITRRAELTSAPPNWRVYLVRTWTNPTPPPDDLRSAHAGRSRTLEPVGFGRLGQGRAAAVEIFLSDLGRLERDIVGMARYRVLLRAGLVEQPRVAFAHRAVQGRPRHDARERSHGPHHRPVWLGRQSETLARRRAGHAMNAITRIEQPALLWPDESGAFTRESVDSLYAWAYSSARPASGCRPTGPSSSSCTAEFGV